MQQLAPHLSQYGVRSGLPKVINSGWVSVYHKRDEEFFVKQLSAKSKTTTRTFLLEVFFLQYLRSPYVIPMIDANLHLNYYNLILDKAIGSITDCMNAKIHVGGKSESLYHRFVTKNFILEMLLAVEFCHLSKILHHDIKPENFVVVVDSKGIFHPKLIDFGISAMLTHSFEITHTNLAYTDVYRPPEVCLGIPHGTPADVWALGCTIYKLLTRENLYPLRIRRDKRDILHIVSVKGYDEWLNNYITPKDHRIFKGLSKAYIWYATVRPFKKLIRKSTAWNPEDRPSMSEMVKLWEALSSECNDDFIGDMNMTVVTLPKKSTLENFKLPPKSKETTKTVGNEGITESKSGSTEDVLLTSSSSSGGNSNLAPIIPTIINPMSLKSVVKDKSPAMRLWIDYITPRDIDYAVYFWFRSLLDWRLMNGFKLLECEPITLFDRDIAKEKEAIFYELLACLTVSGYILGSIVDTSYIYIPIKEEKLRVKEVEILATLQPNILFLTEYDILMDLIQTNKLIVDPEEVFLYLRLLFIKSKGETRYHRTLLGMVGEVCQEMQKL